MKLSQWTVGGASGLPTETVMTSKMCLSMDIENVAVTKKLARTSKASDKASDREP